MSIRSEGIRFAVSSRRLRIVAAFTRHVLCASSVMPTGRSAEASQVSYPASLLAGTPLIGFEIAEARADRDLVGALGTDDQVPQSALSSGFSPLRALPIPP